MSRKLAFIWVFSGCVFFGLTGYAVGAASGFAMTAACAGDLQ
jgi:hypothetical protein